MSDATEALKLAFDKLAELANTYGPPAVNTAAEVVRINAIGSLAVAALGVAMATAGGVVFCRYITKAIKASADWDAWIEDRTNKLSRPSVDSAAYLPVLIPSGAAVVLGLAVSIFRLVNVWTWVALWNPKLALAAKVVNALPGVGQ